MTSTAGNELFATPKTRTGSLARPNLISKLDHERPPRLVTLIAPAGYGKTTAAASIISGLDVAHVWIPIDHRRRTLHSFWQQTTRALTQLAGPIDERPLADLAVDADLDALDDLVASLASGLAEVGQHHVVGFDDLHELDDDTLASLLRLFRLAPPKTTFVATSRHPVPVDLEATAPDGDVIMIDVDDLVFDVAMTRRVLDLASGDRPVDGAAVDLIHERTEGWPLAVGLAADAVRFAGSAALAGITDDVAAGILERLEGTLGPQQHRLLSDVSICSAFTADLAAAVSEAAGSIDLALLVEQTSAIVIVDDHADTYRLHQLVGELLSDKVRSSEPEHWRSLHGRAADWYHGIGDQAAEIDHRLSAEQYTMATELLIATSGDLAVAGRMPLHLEWIRRMPDEFVAENPHLVAQLAEILAVGGEVEESRKLLVQASRSVHVPHHEIWVLAARFFVDWCIGNARSATVAFQAFSDAVEHHAWNDQPAGFPVQHQLLSLAGLCHEVLGESEEARRVNAWLDRSTASFPHLGSNAIVDGAVARQLANDGYMPEAAARAALAVDTTRSGQDESPLNADAHVALAQVAWGAGQLNNANRSLVVAARLDAGWTELFATVRRVLAAEIAASMQRFDRAEEMLNDASSRGAESEASDVIGTFVARRAVAMYATHTKLGESALWSSRLSEEGHQTAPLAVWASCELAAGRAEVVIERFGSSGAHLPRQPLPMIRASLVLMQALLDVDRHLDAERILSATLVAAERHQVLQPIFDCPTVHEIFDPDRAGGLSQEFAASVALGKQMTGQPSISDGGAMPLSEPLSPRELDLVPFLPSRASNRQIADELFVSLNTVKTHLKTIYRKLDVSNRDDAVRRCQNLGLLAASES